MSSQANNHPSSTADATNPATRSPKQRAPALRRHGSSLLLQSIPATYHTIDAEQGNGTQEDVPKTPGVPLEEVPRCADLWFEDGDVIIWAQDKNDCLLYRVHRHVLKESGAEPFCTVVSCEYPNPKTSNETFLNGVWVLKYADQDPVDIMYILKWMYERP
jgi:hypothetical protein